MRHLWATVATACLAVSWGLAEESRAAGATGRVPATLAEWQQAAEEVVAREWSAVEPPTWVVGRPKARVLAASEVSAEARRLSTGAAGKFRVEICICQGLIDRLLDGEVDALAGVIGHELAHVVLGHHQARTDPSRRREASDDVIIGWAASREEEMEADLEGMRLAGAGGYDPQGLLRVFERARARLGDNSFWGSLHGDHPTYTERLAAGDTDRQQLWQAALDFEVGADLLAVGSHACAEACFRAALQQFPQAPEVLANLGYALLMQYYHALPPEYWQRHDVGQPLPVGFATFLPVAPRQARSEEDWQRLRAMWEEGVKHLQAALRQDAAYALALGNLGFAYLVAPDGPAPEVARGYLQRAAGCGTPGSLPLSGETAREEAHSDSNGHVGTGALASWQRALDNDLALTAFAGGEKEAALGLLRRATVGRTPSPASVLYTGPLVNLYVLLGESETTEDQRQAVEGLQDVLPRLPAPSAQWDYAHGKYLRLCQRLGREPVPAAKLLPARPRQVSASLVCGRTRLHLGAGLAGVVKCLGSPDAVVPLGPRGAGLSCWRYASQGLELTFLFDRLVRARLRATAAEVVCHVELTSDGRTAATLAPGEPIAQAEAVLPDYDAAVRLGDGKPYRWYAGARLAVLVEEGKVKALAIVGG